MDPPVLLKEIVEIIEYDTANLALLSGRHIVGKRFDNVEPVDVEPVLALHAALSSMNMRRFIPFVCVEE
jgi:hypothetical protein